MNYSELIQLLKRMEKNRASVNLISKKDAFDLIQAVTNSRYRLIAVVDVAGESAVFKCHDAHDVNRQVAVKIALSAYQCQSIKSVGDPKKISVFTRLRGSKATYNINVAKERFVRGATLQRNLADLIRAEGVKFFSVPEVLEFGENPLYMVMPWIPSDKMTRYLKDRNSLELALGKYINLLDAIAYLHTKGIAHRDIKIANMLPNRDGIELLDFTTAKRIGDKSLTSQGYSKATTSHASPKTLDGGMLNYNAYDDIAELGFALIEFLTFTELKTPEYARNESKLAKMSLLELKTSYLAYRETLAGGIFEPFRDIFLKMTAYEEEERYSFVPDIKKDFVQILEANNLAGNDYLVLTEAEKKQKKLDRYFDNMCNRCGRDCRDGEKFCIEMLKRNLDFIQYAVREELI